MSRYYNGYLWHQYIDDSDDSAAGDEMSKTRTGTELGPPMPEGPNDDGGTADTENETYDGQMIWVGEPWGYSPRAPSGLEHPSYTGPKYFNRQNVDGTLNDTIAGVPSVTSHAPAGIGWITPAAWASAIWDGTPYDVTGKTKAQICNWVFPTSNTMRGLRQLYEAAPPFANPRYPKPWEVDVWNVKVINHFRALFGIGPIQPSYRLYNEAAWATERRWTTRWNAYPATGPLTYGPCPNANVHCGATFIPGIGDQNWYLLPPGSPAPPAGTSVSSMVRESTNEALGGVNTNIPWSIKLARAISVFLCYEGLVGHTGPFLRRQKVGLNFYDIGDGTTQIRFKFGGTYTAFAGS